MDQGLDALGKDLSTNREEDGWQYGKVGDLTSLHE